MTDAKNRFDVNLSESAACLSNFDLSGDLFALRYVWIVSVSAFDFYMTELVSEVGLRWIDRDPPVFTQNLRQVQVHLGNVMDIDKMSPTEKLLFYKDSVYAAVRYVSFYRPEKVSEALSFIWTCPPKQKWGRILAHMKRSGRYQSRTEQDIRGELTLIGDRRDLIAHSLDIQPGATAPNPATRADAAQVIEFMGDLATAIDQECELQLAG